MGHMMIQRSVDQLAPAYPDRSGSSIAVRFDPIEKRGIPDQSHLNGLDVSIAMCIGKRFQEAEIIDDRKGGAKASDEFFCG